MAAMKHTEGPWRRSPGWAPTYSLLVDYENIYGSPPPGSSPPAGVIAKVVRASQDGRYTEEKEGNARLIVAAPEMYRLISHWVAWIRREDSRECIAALEEAACDLIAKMRGKTWISEESPNPAWHLSRKQETPQGTGGSNPPSSATEG